MSRGPKAYAIGNYDGRVQAMVAAANLQEAAKKLSTSANAMRTYGWYLAEGEARELALANPDTVFVRPIMGDHPWITRDEHRARVKEGRSKR